MNRDPKNSMSTPPNTGVLAAKPVVLPCIHPLDDFYAQAGISLPPIDIIQGNEMPEPYKTLLVHQNDMTPTLETFHGDRIHLQVVRRQQRGDFYFREVVLLLDASGAPVEFGAIKISLALFPSAARRSILEEHLPLGHILQEHSIQHASRPKAFLRVQSDALINQALKIKGRQILYGRRNTLSDPSQRPLAEIVEILPPVLPHSPETVAGE